MAENSVENNSGSSAVEQKIEQKVKAQSAEQLKEEFVRLGKWVTDIKQNIEIDLIQNNKRQHDFGSGDKNDTGTERGKANSITELIQKMFYAARNTPEKIPAADKPTPKDPKAPIPTPESTKLLQKISSHIRLEEINDQNAPYFYDLLKSITEGKVGVDNLAEEVRKIAPVANFDSASADVFGKIQKAGVEYAKENNIAEKDANKMFGVQEVSTDMVQNEESQRRAMEERSAESAFNQNWEHIFSGHFNEGAEKDLVKALYSPAKFVDYYEKIQAEEIKKDPSLDKTKIAQKASEQMEVKISLLFAKLYTRLDHESPKEFFQSIEQEDIMKGITPVKSELKRRITLLGTSLAPYQVELEKSGKEAPKFFQRLEQDTETVSVNVKGSLKPRPRFRTKLEAEEASGSHFAHYLDQIVDHYIEARRYTHNSRAVFLHPVDAQTGFYGQLAKFAAETSMLDFDQMMLLPDNDIFQSAFGLYNKMIEEGFAKNDWRHSAGMFTAQLNKHTTQIEGRVLEQLSAMFGDASEERLTAALTMAVGASRGMFLTEVEMAAHADPHLNETGGSTFTSYYHQDATALMAFNPQHLLARFAGGPNLLDPIFFLPVDSFKGSQAFTDHHALWDKAEKYKASFIKGREPLPEQTFFDKLNNIGLVGGPMQRKGWRTAWQLDSLYISDKVTNEKGQSYVKTNHLKTFQHLENIGYELLQDYVTKLGPHPKAGDDDLLKARSTFGMSKEQSALYEQKDALFKYIFEKYFDKDPKDLGKYMDKIRDAKRNEVLGKVRSGLSAPDDIEGEVEAAASFEFLDRMLARVIVKRLPSKIIRMDRDRLSPDGTSRYKKVMKDMGLEGESDKFDNIMTDMLLAEQMLRRDVSRQMYIKRDSGKPGEEWKYGEIDYEMNPDTIKALLGPLIAKGKMDQTRLNNVLKLFGHIQSNYIDFKYTTGPNKGKEFVDVDLVPFFKHGGAQERKSKYTIALDETDMSFIPFRGGGESVLARSLRDVAAVEKGVSEPITQLVKTLRDMAINGKKDFGPVIEIIQKVWGAMDGIIGFPYANELASNLASMTIMYMKKDTQARAMMGAFGIGRFNSMAAESVHRKTGVWEWDSSDIDRFITALEARNLVPGTPYNIASEPEKEPVYLTLPFLKKPMKMPEKISTSKLAGLLGGDSKTGKFKIPGIDKEFTIPDVPLFWKRKRNHAVWSKSLREKFGGTKNDMFFDILNKYLPAFLLFILIAQIKKAFENSEGKKK